MTFITEFAIIVSSSAVLSILAKSTLILLLGLSVSVLATRAKASWRHLAFATTFAALLALPIVVLTAPDLAVATSAAVETQNQRNAAAAPVLASVETAAPAVQTPATPASSMPSLGMLLLSVWPTVVLLLLALLAVDLWRVRTMRRNGLPSRRLREITDLVAADADMRRVEVLLHEKIQAPVTFGFLRPIVMLPASAENWNAPDLRRALVHELEHVRRGDWATHLMARVACSLYWFNPLSWMAWRRMCLEAERACDDAVVASAGHVDYAEQLVQLSRSLSAGRVQPVLGMAKRSDLAHRVSSLLDNTRRRGRAGLTAAACSILVGLLAVISIGPLRAIAQSSPPPVAEKQLEKPLQRDVDDDDDDDRGPNKQDMAIFKAAKRNSVELVKSLLEDGANVNAVIPGDGTPLIGAARGGHLEMVRLLLDRGAKADLGVGGDGNPLLNAAREGHRDVVILLLDRGADINAGIPGDGNALIGASGGGFVNIVELLLDRGADIHKVVAGDENPIIKASETGQLDVVKLLVARGADVNSRVRVEVGYGSKNVVEYRTPLNMARKNRHTPVIEYLLSVGAKE